MRNRVNATGHDRTKRRARATGHDRTKRRVRATGQGRMTRRAGLAGAAAILLALTACEEPAPVDKNVIRAIKWTTLTNGIAEQERRIAGVIEPVEVTALSFEVGGRIEKLYVRLGDRVRAGDVLAELDQEPFRLHVRNAEAEVAMAHAIYKEEVQNLERQRTLFKKGWIAKARLDTAVAGHDAAKSRMGARRAQLDLRQRDLKLAALQAPFDGVISKKAIEAFEEVAAGQTIFELSGERDLKVALRVPPTLINRIGHGQQVAVHFPSETGLVVAGVVTEIGSRAEEANAFPVTVALRKPSARLRAGMSADVVFTFENGAPSHRSLMVPMGAILSGEGQAYRVFRFDKNSSTVHSVPVEIEDLHDNQVQIAGDLRPGDIIATAGVEFLTDGQEVRLMAAEMPYGAGVEQ